LNPLRFLAIVYQKLNTVGGVDMSNQYLLDEDRQSVLEIIAMSTSTIKFDDVEMSKEQAAEIVRGIADHDLECLMTALYGDGTLDIWFC
jgi:hypothetical protein